MSRKIRWLRPYIVYELTARTVDRQFLLKPNHHQMNPLLEQSCPLNALDPTNDVIPQSSIFNIIGAAVGRALDEHPIRLHWVEANISHFHIGFSFDREQLKNVAPFFQHVKSLIARAVNKTWDREGPVFGSRSRMHPCLDEGAAEKQLLYALTNPVKDGLVERVSKSPLFTTYHFQSKGEALRFWYIDYDAYYTAGGERKKSHRLKEYLKWVSWECTPLPEHEGMSRQQRQTWVRHRVREIEAACGEERQEAGMTFIGKAGLYAVNPRERPKTPKESGPEPLCHASDPELAKQYKKEWRKFLDAFIEASADYRRGCFDREFPEGSFRPPLLTVYSS